MKPEEALQALAQMAEAYINTQPPAVRSVLLNHAQQAISALFDATNPEKKEAASGPVN